MFTKKEAELLVMTEKELIALKDPAVAIGYAMASLGHGKADAGDCLVAAARTLYRIAKITPPDEFTKAVRRKEKTFPIGRQNLINLAVEAARKMGAENIADTIIATNRDMPVHKLTTIFPRHSDVKSHTERLAAEKIAQTKKSISDMKAAGAIDVRMKIPTVREVANEFVLDEILRFASYSRMGAEVDYNRSKVTKGNVIHLCCSNEFVRALEKASIPGMGKFKQDPGSVPEEPIWPMPGSQRPAEPARHLWPFPPQA